jgi:uncharacterized protein YyaL (SSP411 family)
MPNRLIHESSPYLQQHAHNPVDWFPWGPEALLKARTEDKPILLSVGYSSCHWCHVMERESFENTETAGLMNRHFVNIKVDREERPDIDAIYMQTVMAITGHGGWPLTVFLTPDLKPFYGGTYFPPEDRHGIAGFPRILQAVSTAYRTSKADVLNTANQIAEALARSMRPLAGHDPLTADTLTEAFQTLASSFDPEHGGIGKAPKFPQAMVWEFLLAYAHRSGDDMSRVMTELTLDEMALGGIYDQIGGGFHRYSVDARWLVPHFEKMLYDNAQLARLYLHAYQVLGKPVYKRVVEEMLDYLLREMCGAEGQFYSAQDADSEGVEGKFYVWTDEQIRGALPEAEREVVLRHYGVQRGGNWEGHTILEVVKELRAVAEELGIPQDEAERRLQSARGKLLTMRSQRVPPMTDTKALTAWNALALSALAEAGRVLGREEYLEAARRNADFLLSRMRANGRLLRTYRDGVAKLNGYLEDYAYLTDALLTLHAATLEARWLDEAQALGGAMIGLFWSGTEGTFYDVGADHEALLVRPREVFDNAVPAGASMAALSLIKLAAITGQSDLAQPAVVSLRSLQHAMAQHPNGFGNWLLALAFHMSAPKEIAIIGKPDNPLTLTLLRTASKPYLPFKVVAGTDSPDSRASVGVALLEGRTLLDGKPTAYVCENYACQLPTNDPAALLSQLGVRDTPATSQTTV